MDYRDTFENRQNCRKLSRIARRWGGEIIRLTQEQYYYLGRQTGISEAPFAVELAVNYSEKTIYCVTPTWYELVHEMGHVFACRQPPRQSSDFDFLGWEWVLARQLKGVRKWIAGNADYGVNPEEDMGDLTPTQVTKLLQERLEDAIQQGIVVKGRAVSIRG